MVKIGNKYKYKNKPGIFTYTGRWIDEEGKLGIKGQKFELFESDDPSDCQMIAESHFDENDFSEE